MKIFSKFASALMVLPLLAALTACESEAEYTPAEQLNTAQVYFGNNLPAAQDLDIESTSFDVPIYRANTKGELTVALQNRQNPASTTQLNVPASVTFADGESTALITITYDPSTIEYNDPNRDTISIADAQYTTPYGDTEYRFAAQIPEPWTDWVSTPGAFAAQGGTGNFPLGSAGTGDYVYSDAFFGPGDDPDLPVAFRQNKLNPLQGEFKISHWGYDVDLIMPAEWDADENYWRLYVPTTFTGYNHSSYGEVYVGDYIAWYDYTGRDPLTWEVLKRNDLESTYDPATGLFSLFVRYYVSAGVFGEGRETFQVHGFYVPDYSVVPTYLGILTDANSVPYAQIDIAFGTDVEKAVAYVVAADADAAAVADALAAGEVEGVELVAGTNNIPVGDLTGELQVVVASVVDGAAAYSDAVKFEYYGGGKNPWTKLGTGYFTDDLILPMFGYEADDYPVEIEESTETPGVYRLLQMYSAVAADFRADSGTGNVIVNAEDPDAVYILPQDLGLTIGQYGPFSITSDAGEYVSQYGFDAVKAQLPEIFAKLQNGVITFPVLEEEASDGSMVSYQLWVILNGGYYFGGRAGQFKIVLPGASAEAKAEVRARNFRARLAASKSMRTVGDVKQRYAKRAKASNKMNLVPSAKLRLLK